MTARGTGRARVTVHNLISVDGRLDGFTADLGLYYELAANVTHQAVRTGSGTMLAAAAREGLDLSGEDADRAPPAVDDTRPWPVIVDSRGRLTRLDWLRASHVWLRYAVVGDT